MEQSFHYLLMANQAIFQKGVFARLKGSGMTMGQPKVLDYLQLHDGASQKEIAKACHIEPASLTTILKGMEEKGLVERRMMNGNRRTMHVFVTEKGRDNMAKLAEIFSYMEAVAFDQIPEEEQTQFMRTFEKIYNNITKERSE